MLQLVLKQLLSALHDRMYAYSIKDAMFHLQYAYLQPGGEVVSDV